MLRLFSPRWMLGHLGVLILAVAFTLLGRWQWDEAHSPGGDLQNWIYAIQWWLFIAVGLYGWGKTLQHERREPGSTRRPPKPAPDADALLANYGPIPDGYRLPDYPRMRTERGTDSAGPDPA
jgi:hypothetical protein